jgi:hypothetical protein
MTIEEQLAVAMLDVLRTAEREEALRMFKLIVEQLTANYDVPTSTLETEIHRAVQHGERYEQ